MKLVSRPVTLSREYTDGHDTTMLNWLAVAILLGAVATSGYYRKRARAGSETIARRREGNFFLAIRATFSLLLIIPVFANAVAPRWMTWAGLDLPDSIRWFGVAVGLLAILSTSWVLRSLGQSVSETVLTKKDHQFVMTGPYRWVRHPLYTTGVTLFIVIGLVQASWFVLVVSAITVLLIELLVIPAEERALLAKFGEQYRAYMTRTGRWLPRL